MRGDIDGSADAGRRTALPPSGRILMTAKGQPGDGRHRDLYLVFDEPDPPPGYAGPPSRGRVMTDTHNAALTVGLTQRLHPIDASAIASDVMTSVMERW